MKKIPCLFVREFTQRADGRGKDFVIASQVTPGLEWVLEGKGVPTRKFDGTACLVKDGRLYKRYDAKRGKLPPPDSIPCDEPDPLTGHHPHWVLVGGEPESKWHKAAFDSYAEIGGLADDSYELCGPHFQTNPHGYATEVFIRHGGICADELLGPQTFESLRDRLSAWTKHEGIVWWRDGEPRCKLRRADFGFAWPVKP